ncbi:streptomycin biosynthesis enzyme StrG [Nannocystis pusilla]
MVMAAHLLAEIDRARLAREAGPLPRRTHVLLSYDTARFPFAAALGRDVFKVHRLDRLHEYLQQQRARQGGARRLSARDNVMVRAMMARQPEDAIFWRLYHGFMLSVLAPLVGRGISYTSHPKLRIHLSGTSSVSSFHHDICVTKRPDQINFWVPFTDVDGTATLWLESDYGEGDFAPVPVRYGQVLIFDGGYLGHGSVDNVSGVTRVSLDMRFSYKKATTRAEGVSLMDRIIQVSDAKPEVPPHCAPAVLPGPATGDEEERL